jgi:hypothetical protein
MRILDKRLFCVRLINAVLSQLYEVAVDIWKI